MEWLRLVGSLKLQVSFAKEPYKRDHILQKETCDFQEPTNRSHPVKMISKKSPSNALPRLCQTDLQDFLKIHACVCGVVCEVIQCRCNVLSRYTIHTYLNPTHTLVTHTLVCGDAMLTWVTHASVGNLADTHTSSIKKTSTLLISFKMQTPISCTFSTQNITYIHLDTPRHMQYTHATHLFLRSLINLLHTHIFHTKCYVHTPRHA